MVSSGSDLAGLLAVHPGTVLLTQASTPTEARLIRDRIAAAGGTGRPPVSLGPPGAGSSRLPSALLEEPDLRLVPVRVAWLPEEHAGKHLVEPVAEAAAAVPLQVSIELEREARVLERGAARREPRSPQLQPHRPVDVRVQRLRSTHQLEGRRIVGHRLGQLDVDPLTTCPGATWTARSRGCPGPASP